MSNLRHLSIGVLVVAGLATPSLAGTNLTQQWGLQGDIPVPRDYDQDGKADFAVWRPADGTWNIKGSVTGIQTSVQWGQAGDVPVPGDFDHDGHIDYVVWRPSTGNWHIRNAVTGAMSVFQWGALGDIPLAGDFDGDGVPDFAVYRPSNGWWYVRNSVTFATTSAQWGQPGDVPIVGDYDGVPGDDFTVYRPQTGEWLTMGSVTRAFRSTYRWGSVAGDVPLTAQFGCSHKAGQTIWRPTQGWWSWGLPVLNWGVPGDIPVPANFLGDYAADYAVWRPSTGTWFVTENDKNARVCEHRWDAAAALADQTLTNVEGVVIAAVKRGRVVWTYGAGMANDSHPATPDIPFQLASISKLFVGTAVLQVVDMGLIDPDAVGGLTNPWNGAQPLLRDYANHTSGMRAGVCTTTSGIEPIQNLGVVLDPCLFWGPAPQIAWNNRFPGVFEYSNLGAAWPARRLELATGVDFAQFTRDHILTPLGMTSTAWFAHDLAGQPISQSFLSIGSPSPVFSASPYAIGNLRSSANDLTRFMMMWLGNGFAFNHTFLSPASVARGMSGFYWLTRWVNGRQLRAHDGKLDGICTQLDIDPGTNAGFVILTNGSCGEARPHIDAIESQVLATLDTL